MYYGLLGTLTLLYIGWMLMSWRVSLEDGGDRPSRLARLGGWVARVTPR
jgi:hypothetical protein